jgi:hypothetical protein
MVKPQNFHSFTFYLGAAGDEPRTLHVPGKGSTAELQLQPQASESELCHPWLPL